MLALLKPGLLLRVFLHLWPIIFLLVRMLLLSLLLMLLVECVPSGIPTLPAATREQGEDLVGGAATGRQQRRGVAGGGGERAVFFLVPGMRNVLLLLLLFGRACVAVHLIVPLHDLAYLEGLLLLLRRLAVAIVITVLSLLLVMIVVVLLLMAIVVILCMVAREVVSSGWLGCPHNLRRGLEAAHAPSSSPRGSANRC